MKLGLGLYRHMLTAENYRFARQCGCTQIVAHLVNYFDREPRLPGVAPNGWGRAGDPDRLWSEQELVELREGIEAEGLELAAIENFDPAHWHDVLLDGPRKAEQMENIKELIRRAGAAGIPVLGYNFSIAGVWGHVQGPWARGGAESVAFLGAEGPAEEAIPQGMVWNMVHDEAALETGAPQPLVSHEQLWERLEGFLREAVPVAEQAGVRLAAHPDDPPMPTLRGQARLVYQPGLYQRLLDIRPSRSNALEFCLGSLAEMTEGDIYETVEQYARQDAIAYIHFRNVRGKVPHYHEVFVDEGDVDMLRVVRILRECGYDGVLIPDHTPQMTCGAPWHAGMAYALGFMQAALRGA